MGLFDKMHAAGVRPVRNHSSLSHVSPLELSPHHPEGKFFTRLGLSFGSFLPLLLSPSDSLDALYQSPSG